MGHADETLPQIPDALERESILCVGWQLLQANLTLLKSELSSRMIEFISEEASADDSA